MAHISGSRASSEALGLVIKGTDSTTLMTVILGGGYLGSLSRWPMLYQPSQVTLR